MNNGKDVHVYMYESKNKQNPNDPRWAYNYSHLCHHWWCCNPEHIIREPDWLNIFRKSDCIENGVYQCRCTDIQHPLFVDLPIRKCIWYNWKAKCTLQELVGYSEKDLLDEDFIQSSLCLDKLDGDLKKTIVYQIKDLL